MASQLSGLRHSAFDRRKAISGEILLSPFNSLLSVEGDTLRLWATFLTLSPKGVIYTSLINSPGCGGLCIAISGNPHNLRCMRSHL